MIVINFHPRQQQGNTRVRKIKIESFGQKWSMLLQKDKTWQNNENDFEELLQSSEKKKVNENLWLFVISFERCRVEIFAFPCLITVVYHKLLERHFKNRNLHTFLCNTQNQHRFYELWQTLSFVIK